MSKTLRIPVQTVVVHRDGKRVVPELNKPFDFTAQELADIERLNPSAIREPVNELADKAAVVIDGENITNGKPAVARRGRGATGSSESEQL